MSQACVPLTENMINHVTKMTRQKYKKINWHNAELYLKPLLEFDEFIQAVRDIVGRCLDDDGRLLPELLDFSTRIGIITYYGCVETPESLERMYEIAYTTDLYDAICKSVNEAQLNALRRAVRDSAGLP